MRTHGAGRCGPGIRDRRSPTTEDTARTLRRAIDFNLYLQWIADGQLAAAAAAATVPGMTLGLYRDVAVGASRGGQRVSERF